MLLLTMMEAPIPLTPVEIQPCKPCSSTKMIAIVKPFFPVLGTGQLLRWQQYPGSQVLLLLPSQAIGTKQGASRYCLRRSDARARDKREKQ
jgi:hypothetical protein